MQGNRRGSSGASDNFEPVRRVALHGARCSGEGPGRWRWLGTGGLGAAALISDGSTQVQRPWRGGLRWRRWLGEARRSSAAAATRRGKATCGAEALGCGGSSTNLEGGGQFDAPWPRAAHLDSGHLGNGDGDNLDSRECGAEHLGDDFYSGLTWPWRLARVHGQEPRRLKKCIEEGGCLFLHSLSSPLHFAFLEWIACWKTISVVTVTDECYFCFCLVELA
jgi:hypothetical protein